MVTSKASKSSKYTKGMNIRWRYFRPPEFNVGKALEIIRVAALIGAIVLLLQVRDGQEEARQRGLHIICSTEELDHYSECMDDD